MEGLFDFVQHRLAPRLPALPGKSSGRTGERGDELVLLPVCRLELLGVERPVGFPERLFQRQELSGLLGR